MGRTGHQRSYARGGDGERRSKYRLGQVRGLGGGLIATSAWAPAQVDPDYDDGCAWWRQGFGARRGAAARESAPADPLQQAESEGTSWQRTLWRQSELLEAQ